MESRARTVTLPKLSENVWLNILWIWWQLVNTYHSLCFHRPYHPCHFWSSFSSSFLFQKILSQGRRYPKQKYSFSNYSSISICISLWTPPSKKCQITNLNIFSLGGNPQDRDLTTFFGVEKHSEINALSFYVTKTVFVGPKWFWSDQIDLVLTIMIWSQPKWNGHGQNELVRSKCDSFW